MLNELVCLCRPTYYHSLWLVETVWIRAKHTQSIKNPSADIFLNSEELLWRPRPQNSQAETVIKDSWSTALGRLSTPPVQQKLRPFRKEQGYISWNNICEIQAKVFKLHKFLFSDVYNITREEHCTERQSSKSNLTMWSSEMLMISLCACFNWYHWPIFLAFSLAVLTIGNHYSTISLHYSGRIFKRHLWCYIQTTMGVHLWPLGCVTTSCFQFLASWKWHVLFWKHLVVGVWECFGGTAFFFSFFLFFWEALIAMIQNIQ